MAQNNNLLPQIIVNLVESLENPGTPKFQKEIIAANLERVERACFDALSKYNTIKDVRKRG
jgi:hypothetical protein